MKQKVKVGIIGLGTIGKVHADAYGHCSDAELMALCDVDADRLAACRGECPPAATAAKGLTVMRLMDGVDKSAKSGQEVKL